MASLTPPYPSPSNLAVRKLKHTIAASAAPNPNLLSRQEHRTVADVVQKALVTADSKRRWWAPLFRFGSDRETTDEPAGGSCADEEKEGPTKAAARRSVLTAEKARLLRQGTRATETWHDAMYHSAIASRLASPDQL